MVKRVFPLLIVVLVSGCREQAPPSAARSKEQSGFGRWCALRTRWAKAVAPLEKVITDYDEDAALKARTERDRVCLRFARQVRRIVKENRKLKTLGRIEKLFREQAVWRRKEAARLVALKRQIERIGTGDRKALDEVEKLLDQIPSRYAHKAMSADNRLHALVGHLDYEKTGGCVIEKGVHRGSSLIEGLGDEKCLSDKELGWRYRQLRDAVLGKRFPQEVKP